MPTVFTHPAIPLAVRAVTGGTVISRRLLLTAAICSVLPDADSIGYFAGVPYESLFGHRGFSHSLLFAALLASGALALAKWLEASRWWAFALVFLSAASHGILDAFTDGGLGIAFLSPFSNQRFFSPWRPIPVSPLGILDFFSSSGLQVLAAEILLIWLPCLLLVVGARTAMRRSARDRSGLVTSAWAPILVGAILAITSTIAGAYGAAVSTGRSSDLRAPSPSARPRDADQAMRAEAIENLEAQVDELAARPGPSCPQDFPALDTGRPLRISLFYGFDNHEGRVYDRVDAGAMTHVLTGQCRGQLSTCGFALVARAPSAVTLTRTLGGRRVDVNLFTTSLPDEARAHLGLFAAYREQDRLSRLAKARFYRELVHSDVVFFMGHSRLGGGMGFDRQTGVTTLVNAISRRPLRPVLEAVRQRPTQLKIMGMFSCDSNRYFRQDLQDANPSLALILTTGDIDYGPAEQASLGALEAVLSQDCGHAFHRSMIAVSDPDPDMTRLFRGR